MSGKRMEYRQRHDPSKSLVGFFVGSVHYAIPIGRVKEIANPLEMVALPHAPHAVVGVADYRGQVVPVIDLRMRFGMEAGPATRRTKWLVVEVGPRIVALVVDAVSEVFGTGGADLRPAPSLGGGDDTRGIAGVANHDGSLVFVLDTARLRDLTEPLAAAGQIGASDQARSLLPGAPT